MSITPPLETSPNHATTCDEDTTASPSTLSRVPTNIIPTSHTDVHHGDSSNNVSMPPSPSLDRSRRRPSPVERQGGVSPVDFVPNGFNQVKSVVTEGSNPLPVYNSSNLRQLAEAQQEPIQSTLSDATNTSITRDRNSRAISPAGWLKRECEELRKKQEELQINIDGPSRTPLPADFPRVLSMKIVNSVQPVESCIILMHNLASSEASLERHVEVLRIKQPQSAFILLRGVQPIEPGNSGYHWADANGTMDEGFIKTSRVILEDIIRDGLIAKCSFHPRDIVVLGHGQGGMAALAATACWNCVEFGGVISFGGPMPGYVQLPSEVKAKTPALIYGVTRGEITPTALQQIKGNFSFTDHHVPPSEHDTVPLADKEILPLLEFLAHRLGREEWKRQAVISFDGGGIRGYGSLLILQDLMNKIGDEEKTLDPTVQSSFSPRDYKPTNVKGPNASSGSANSLPSNPSNPPDAGAVGPTGSHRLLNSALFLPCHYFTYAAGSSTGGLISIMLSRFRMTVDDCIAEYKTLGKKIFGHPRRMAKGGFPWHRFNAKVLEDVIRAVTSTHNMQREDFGNLYGMERADEDMLLFSLIRTMRGVIPLTYSARTELRRHLGIQAARESASDLLEILGGPRCYQSGKSLGQLQQHRGISPPIRIETDNGSKVITFKDGGFGSNNPSEEAYRDILNKHGGIVHMGPFISIGTGITPLDMFGRRSDNLSTAIANAKTAIKLPSRTLRAHENMVWHANEDDEERFPYFRFDGGPKLGEVDLGEWESHRFTRITGRDETSGRKTLEKIETAVAVYLQDREVQKELTECAKLLVKRRRLRTRNMSEWDRYASYSHYVCDMKKCDKRRWNTAHGFKEHLRRDHKFKLVDPVIDNKIAGCRHVQWLYQPIDTAQESAAKKKGKGRA